MKIKNVLTLLMLISPSLAFAIAGPLEIITVGLPFLPPFFILYCSILTLISYLKLKRLYYPFVVLALTSIFFFLSTNSNQFYKWIGGPFRIEELGHYLDGYPYKGISPTLATTFRYEDGYDVLYCLPEEDLFYSAETNEVVSPKTFVPKREKLVILDMNLARALDTVVVMKGFFKYNEYYFSPFDIYPDRNIHFNDNSVDLKLSSFSPLNILIIFSSLFCLLLIYRSLDLIISLKTGKVTNFKNLVLTTLFICLNLALYHYLFRLGITFGSKELVDASIIYSTFLLLFKYDIVFNPGLFTYLLALTSSFLFFLFPYKKFKLNLMESIKKKDFKIFCRDFKKPIFLAILTILSIIYFRLTHYQAIYLSLYFVAHSSSQGVLHLITKFICASAKRKAAFFKKLFDIKGNNFSADVTFDASFIKNSLKDSKVYRLWSYLFWTNNSDIITHSDPPALALKDILTNIHPKWAKGLHISPTHFDGFSDSITPLMSDLLHFRFSYQGVENQAKRKLTRIDYIEFNLNPYINIGGAPCYISSKEKSQFAPNSFTFKVLKLLIKFNALNGLKTIKLDFNIKNKVTPTNLTKELAKEIKAFTKVDYSASFYNQVIAQYPNFLESEMVFRYLNKPLNYEIHERMKLLDSDSPSTLLDKVKNLLHEYLLFQIDSIARKLSLMELQFDFQSMISFLSITELLQLNEANRSLLRKKAEERLNSWEASRGSRPEVLAFLNNTFGLENEEERSSPSFKIISSFRGIFHGVPVNLEVFYQIDTSILCIEHIKPSEVKLLSPSQIIILNKATYFSHSSILLRELNIAAVQANTRLQESSPIMISPEGKLAEIQDSLSLLYYDSYVKKDQHTPKALAVSKANSYKKARLPFGGVLLKEALSKEKICELAKEIIDYFPSCTKKIILRSSGELEDSTLAEIGMFKSIIADFNASAIEKGLSSFIFDGHYSGDILVQEYFNFDYSGVIFSQRKSEGLQGIEYSQTGTAITEGQHADSFIIVKDNEIISSKGKHLLLKEIMSFAYDLVDFYDMPLDIEFGVINQTIFLLQLRPLTDKQVEFLQDLARR